MSRDLKGHSLLRTDLKDFVVVDLETTGLSPSLNDIIEIGAVKYRDGSPIECYSTLVKPPVKQFGSWNGMIPRGITYITGIRNADVQNSLTIDKLYPSFIQFIKEEIIVGHNVNFDINFLYDNGIRLHQPVVTNDFVDTLRLSRKYLYNELSHHSLSNVSRYFGIVNKQAHRALSDCLTTGDVYLALCEYINKLNAEMQSA